MKKYGRGYKHICLLLAVFLLLCCMAGCGKKKPEPDPHEGQVYLYDGYDWTWYTPKEGARLNTLVKEDFNWQNGKPIYVGTAYTTKTGIDVSEHQLEIDWSEISKQNYDFIYVRVGRRGYTQGGIFEDEYFEQNIQGASQCGAELGVYFFSQATSVAEAIEEANWVLDRIKGYNITLPITYDWEEQKTEDSRTAGLDGNTVTDCAVAFCETVKNAGYEPCIYMNRIPGYYTFDISRLQNYKIWFALPCTPPDVTFPSFYYHIDMWQFSATEQIPGIPVETDMNYLFIPLETEESDGQ